MLVCSDGRMDGLNCVVLFVLTPATHTHTLQSSHDANAAAAAGEKGPCCRSRLGGVAGHLPGPACCGWPAAAAH